MNVGIAGANGFIGSNLCKVNLELGNMVFAICNNRVDNVPAECNIVTIDIAKTIVFDQLFISIGSHSSSHKEFILQYDFLRKVISTLKFERILFISSIAVFGCHSKLISLNSSFRNPSLYGLSKLSQEFLVSSCPNYIIIRPTYIYGIGMSQNSLIPIWIRQAICDRKIKVLGNGHRLQDYLHIDDLIRLCLSAANKAVNGIIIGASGTSYSNLTLAQTITKYLEGTEIQYYGNDFSSSFDFDVTSSFNFCDWKPQVSFEIGLKNYIEHENSYL